MQGDYQKSLDFALNFALTKAFYSVDGLFVPTLLLIIGDDYYALEQFELSERAYQMSIAAFPMYRDSYIALAALYMRTGRMVEAKDILYQSLQKTKKLHSWLERDLTWTYLPYDLLSQIHYTLGEIQQATDFAYLAYQMEPSLERLRVNYEILKNETKTEIKCDLQSREELEQAFKQRQVKKEEVN